MKTAKISLNSIDKVKAFVNEISKFDCDFDLVSGRYVIDAKSIMGIFSLDLSKPIDLNIHADGSCSVTALWKSSTSTPLNNHSSNCRRNCSQFLFLFTVKVLDGGCTDVQARLHRCTDIGQANSYEQVG